MRAQARARAWAPERELVPLELELVLGMAQVLVLALELALVLELELVRPGPVLVLAPRLLVLKVLRRGKHCSGRAMRGREEYFSVFCDCSYDGCPLIFCADSPAGLVPGWRRDTLIVSVQLVCQRRGDGLEPLIIGEFGVISQKRKCETRVRKSGQIPDMGAGGGGLHPKAGR